ncbi:MAG: UDP-N-acetylmuramoyl-tripeptide--D-alanyl-D-alanine ligase, partial [Gemmatimonadetes bacterium]|nr:UDP-N-acetylmuramoyl-tripeptide--D-alanyl-D-alanine ligase [Gemmatimonadota bacterium]
MSAAFAWTDSTVRDALGLPPRSGTPASTFPAISTDTRTAGHGELFVALVGDSFDGHDFLGEAAARELGGAVVSRETASSGSLPLYRVADTLDALGALARYRRRALPARIAAITGSSGKTTVKEILAAALSGSFRVHATQGNQNNRVGVPLTLLAAPDSAEVVVLEMGTSVPGEISTLTAIAEPDAGLVTTVSEAHLEGLGSFEGVLEEKLALVQGAKRDAVLVVGDDPPALPRRAREIREGVHVAGLSDAADPELKGKLLSSGPDGRYRVRFSGREIGAGMPGKHGARNLVLALSLAKLLGADAESAARGAAAVHGRKLRNEVRAIGGLTLLLDCYNANPQSVAAALDLLGEIPSAGGRVALLASM